MTVFFCAVNLKQRTVPVSNCSDVLKPKFSTSRYSRLVSLPCCSIRFFHFLFSPLSALIGGVRRYHHPSDGREAGGEGFGRGVEYALSFSNFCFLLLPQITSAKVRSIFRKYQMPVMQRTEVRTTEVSNVERFRGDSPRSKHQRKPSITPTIG